MAVHEHYSHRVYFKGSYEYEMVRMRAKLLGRSVSTYIRDCCAAEMLLKTLNPTLTFTAPISEIIGSQVPPRGDATITGVPEANPVLFSDDEREEMRRAQELLKAEGDHATLKEIMGLDDEEEEESK